ncbi:hypothetical protein BAUCODRAFT_127097 [Baudoinia panamericana UAMH 10762]|uniref:GST N-terminal domain-containing protein n=1 Tax=Baudoinia panamericana (strain UAMH 10762) TaxID=717646 RepID=M2LBG1_BAUPA|nr:uncharacterized protein BAUCODRAFT_127097 [Baudoinia panamericana UAMH 10762]EMC91182.1 hypothetical protein BAUCODRAFT_127097 [Baudoinia panamericana UAMH 10762]
MSDKRVVLFDLARRGGNSCWSFNVWKTRLVLNYKGIPYTTSWITHPEIAPTFDGLGIPPNMSGQGSPYSVPMIRLPNGDCVMDSAAIANKLEELYPQPSLHLDAGLHGKATAAGGKVAGPLVPIFMPRVGRDMVAESSVSWFREARHKMFGMSLEDLEATRGGKQAWAAAKAATRELEAWVKETKKEDGPFLLGSEVSYADFVIVAFMEALKRIGPDIYDRVCGDEEALVAMHHATTPWLKRDN